MRAAAIVAALALSLAACGRRSVSHGARKDDAAIALDAAVPGPRATTVVLDAVQVELHGRVERLLDPRELGRSFARCLIEGGAPVVALEEQALPGEVVAHLALALTITDHDPTADNADVVVEVDVAGRWRDDATAPLPAASLTGAATPRSDAPPGTDPLGAAAVAVALALEPQVCTRLATRLTVWSTDDLRPPLGSGDPVLVRWTLSVIAARAPLEDAAARLALIDVISLHLLGEPEVRDAAIAALVAQGDPRAVSRLTAVADVGDAAVAVRIVEAVARLGGDDARDFLEVMTSHHDPQVARAARAGLAALRAPAVAAPASTR